jgi:NADH-quinone oxidoreductase subunit L
MDYTVGDIAPIVLLPFFAFVFNSFIVKRFTKSAVTISVLAIFGSFLYSLRIFSDFIFRVHATDYYIHKYFNWFDLSYGDLAFKVDLGVYLDNMTAVMLLMVSGVATLIHVFSTFYMKEDARFGRFFVYLSLFSAAMLGLVLADNLLLFFCFWEIMGFCSYSLIGFYYEKDDAGDASLKAFMTTRVGDVFFLFGILGIWSVVGSVNLVDIYAGIEAGFFNDVTALTIPLATLTAGAIFMGTIGKSAQFPLQVWLPDAMMGPTPCSALIHAATMVAAGVYLSLRMYPLMVAGEITTFIAYIGAITAFGAATMALVQTDIKAVLAYSTISQLGYMVLGIGVGAYNASFMHLITHAVFKACLFLAAGSVIHSLHDHHTDSHVQEMPRMGGLRHKLPFTFTAMIACTLAIAGIPFFSGFVSKDRILGDALLAALHEPALIPVAVLGFVAALLTAFYMFRMIFLTFFGEPRDKELYDHTHTEHLSWNQNVPLLILTLFTLGLFYSGSMTGQGLFKVFPKHGYEWFSTLIEKPHLEKFDNYTKQVWSDNSDATNVSYEKSLYDSTHGLGEEAANHVHHVHVIGAIISIIIAFSGVFLAYMFYYRRKFDPAWWSTTFSGWYRSLLNKYYFDDFYIKGLIGKVLLPVNAFLGWLDLGVYDRFLVDGWERVNALLYRFAKVFDNVFIDRIGVDGVGSSVRLFNVVLRTVQSGKIQFYFIMIFLVLAGYVWTL